MWQGTVFGGEMQGGFCPLCYCEGGAQCIVMFSANVIYGIWLLVSIACNACMHACMHAMCKKIQVSNKQNCPLELTVWT